MKKFVSLLIVLSLSVVLLAERGNLNPTGMPYTLEQPISPTARDAGDVLNSFPVVPPENSWGVAFVEGSIYVSDATWMAGGDVALYIYDLSGNLTGTFDCSSWLATGAWMADMAYDDGFLYIMDVSGGEAIHKIDIETGEEVAVITGGWATWDPRGVAFDPATGDFYVSGWNVTPGIFHADNQGNTIDIIPESDVACVEWHPAGNGGQGSLLITRSMSGQIDEIDPTTGEILSSFTNPAGTYGTGIDIDNLGNIWTIDQDGHVAYNVDSGILLLPPEAPGIPTDVIIEPDDSGDLKAMLTWNNPTLNVGGNNLGELTSLNLYRSNELIHQIANPVIGATESYLDLDVPAYAIYQYKIVGENSLGEGIPYLENVYVGSDVPACVSNVSVVQSEPGVLSATITWENPTTGLNGGAFVEEILGYHIIRVNDGTEVELVGITTGYIDDTIPSSDMYQYEIIAYNAAGDGGTAISDPSLIATPDLLVLENFVTWIPTGWSIEGGDNWMQTDTDNAGGQAPEAGFNWNPSTVAVQRLISPVVNTESVTELELSFCHQLNDYNGDYTVRLESSGDGANWNTILEIPSVSVGPEEVLITINNEDVGSSGFRFAFVFDGDSYNTNWWCVDDVMLKITQGGSSTEDVLAANTIKLFQNHPNPFNPSTEIRFETTYSQDSQIEIYNLKGQKIKTFNINSNEDSITWNGTDNAGKSVATGIYLYKLRSNNMETCKRMLLLK
jgi:Secretion system C-terminal sorting domain